jgi:hypothetical protein
MTPAEKRMKEIQVLMKVLRREQRVLAKEIFQNSPFQVGTKIRITGQTNYIYDQVGVIGTITHTVAKTDGTGSLHIVTQTGDDFWMPSTCVEAV